LIDALNAFGTPTRVWLARYLMTPCLVFFPHLPVAHPIVVTICGEGFPASGYRLSDKYISLGLTIFFFLERRSPTVALPLICVFDQVPPTLTFIGKSDPPGPRCTCSAHSFLVIFCVPGITGAPFFYPPDFLRNLRPGAVSATPFFPTIKDPQGSSDTFSFRRCSIPLERLDYLFFFCNARCLRLCQVQNWQFTSFLGRHRSYLPPLNERNPRTLGSLRDHLAHAATVPRRPDGFHLPLCASFEPKFRMLFPTAHPSPRQWVILCSVSLPFSCWCISTES